MALYHSARGSVGYTIVGNPTIVDGIASGFSSSNYLVTQSSLPGTDFEVGIKFKCTDLSVANTLVSGTTGSPFAFSISLRTTGKIRIYSAGPGYNSEFDKVFNADTDYYIRIIRSSLGYSMYWSMDGINYTIDTRSNILSSNVPGLNTLNIGKNYSSAPAEPFQGSIDLNNTYIKVNGQPWFGNCPVEVKKHQLMGPVGYEVTGAPTVVEGVMSGFTANDYAVTTSAFDGSKPFKIHLDLNYTHTGSSQFFLSLPGVNAGNVGFYFNNTGTNIAAQYASSGYWTAITGLPADGDLAFDLEGNGTNLTVTVTKGGQTYTNSTTYSALNFGSDSYYVRFGRRTTNQPFTSGSINFNNTYVKVNGKLWFYQPAPTKYIVKDGKLVWGAQDLYLNDGGTITQATQDIVPVPSGFTYGSTTTTDIGLVDIPTQVFTAHPGATIGQGTPPAPVIQNYTVVGSPTISGTTASGFSANDYLTVSNSTLPSTINSFEIICDLDATNGYRPSGTSDRGNILSPATQLGHAPSIDFRYYDASWPNMLYVFIPNDQHTMINAMTSAGCPVTTSNAVGVVKVTYSSSSVKVYVKGLKQGASTSSWTLAGSASLSNFTLGWDDLLAIGNGPTNTTDPRWFPGSVDLSKWSITINGERWWPFTPWS